jgi:hypothetical protein
MAGHHKVDLLVDPTKLNSRLKEIGEWLVVWQMPHQIRVVQQASTSRLRFSFPSENHARAFELQFGGEVVTDKVERAWAADAADDDLYERLAGEFPD